MTQANFDPNQFDQLILQRLPVLMRQNQQIQELVLELARENFAERQGTEDKFYQILNELKQDREAQARKWEEQEHKWEEFKEYTQEQNRKWEAYTQEQNLKWEEQNHKWEVYAQEQNLKWEEQNLKWEEYKKHTQEQNLKWEEQNRKWEEFKEYTQEQNYKWDEAQRESQRMHEAIMAIAQKHDRSIGALGARWGMQSENSFRKALAAILEKSFQVKVINVNEYDDEGVVFGRPDQVELDVIIKNGLLIICEIKSSVSKSDMHIFERKVRFYEQRHHQPVNRMLVISPMIDAKAYTLAESLGIEVYSDSIDVKSL